MAVPLGQSKSASTGLKGLVFLENKNAILNELLYPMLFDGKREGCDVTFGDFDEFQYKFTVDPGTPNVVKLNVGMKAGNDFKKNGTTELIARLFPGIVATADATYDVALQFDCDKYANNTAFLNNVASIKRHMMGGPLDKAFSALATNTSVPATSYAYRMSESLFITPSKDRVVVIFLIDFQDTMDKAMARIFLQEFVEGQRSVRTAPPVSFSKEPPQELTGVKFGAKDNYAGFISFAIEKRHIEVAAKKEQVITLLTGFRSYLHYHIKCSKTYLQMRMRKRVAGWLQVLQRAVPEVETEKKTAGGKTFVRK